MKFRFNPLLVKTLNFRKRSFLSKDKPVWFDSISIFPPPEKVSNFVVSGLETQFNAKERLDQAAQRQAFNATRLNRRAKSISPQNTTKPPSIVYEEDEVRNAFFRQHPYELGRPKNLDVNYEDVCWDSIYGTPKQDLCGENVVQRTMYLYRNDDSLNSAYQQALLEFYKGRREEEESLLKSQSQEYTIGLKKWEEEMKEKKLNDPDFVIPNDPEYFFGRNSTRHFMEKERLELAEGLAHRKSLMETVEIENEFPKVSEEKQGKLLRRPNFKASVKY